MLGVWGGFKVEPYTGAEEIRIPASSLRAFRSSQVVEEAGVSSFDQKD